MSFIDLLHSQCVPNQLKYIDMIASGTKCLMAIEFTLSFEWIADLLIIKG